MLDIHTHILPAMDDGSDTPELSAAMLESEKRQGVRTVALTPHYHAGRESPEMFINRRFLSEQALLNHVKSQTGIPRLLTGAEVAYFDGMSRCQDIDLLCIGNTNAMLIEMPFCKWNRRMMDELQELRVLRGIQPVLAHVERYFSFQSGSLFEQLDEIGMLTQVNSSFFLRWQTARRSMSLLKHRYIDLIASDCHNMEHRAPNLGEAVQKIEERLGADAVEFLKENADKLIGG